MLANDVASGDYFHVGLANAMRNKLECQEELARLRRDYYHKSRLDRFFEFVTRKGFPLKEDYKHFASGYLLLTLEWQKKIVLFQRLIELHEEEKALNEKERLQSGDISSNG